MSHGRGRFVGRSAELATLQEGFAGTEDRRSRVVLVTGDTGVGKSRLVAEFLAGLVPDSRDGTEHDDSLLLRGGCLPRHGELLPYAPLWEAVARYGQAPAEPEAEPAVRALARHLRSGGEEPGFPPGEESVPRVVSTAQALGDLCVGRRLVLVLEDLHWSDPSTQALLTHLVRTGRPEGALVIGTYRDDEPSSAPSACSWPAELELLGAHRVRLAGLAADAAGVLVRSLLGPDAAEAHVESVVARAGGNPLALEQLCLSTSGPHRPSTPLTEILTARVNALDTQVRAVVHAIAVSGGQMSHALLSLVTGVEERTLSAVLHRAGRHHLIRPDPGSGDYALRHPLMGEVVYGTMPAGDRQRQHRALATTLVSHQQLSPQHGFGLWAQVAHHFDAAQEREAALDAHLRAGLAAHEVSAVSEARHHFARAENLWSDLTTADTSFPVDRDSLRMHLAEVSYLDGDATAAVTWIRGVLDVVDAESSPVRAAVLFERLGRYLWAAGHSSDEMLDACREAVRHAPSWAPRERAQALASMGQALMLATRFTEADAYCRDALRVAESVGNHRVLAHAATTLGVIEALSGHHTSGIARLRSAARTAVAHGLPEDRLRAQGNLGVALALGGRLREAAEVLLPTLDQARSWGMEDSHGAFLLSNTLGVLFDLGHWDEVQARLADARVGAGYLRASAALDIVAARISAARGDFDVSESALQHVRGALEEGGDSWANAQLLVARTELATWRGDHMQTRRCTLQFLELHSGTTPDNEMRAEAVAPLLRAEAEHHQFRRAAGLTARREDKEAVARLVDHTVSLESRRVSAVAEAHLASARAELSRIHGDGSPSLWRSVAERYRQLDNPVNVAYARWREAEVLLATGSGGARAARCVSEALVISDRLRLTPMLEKLHALSGSHTLQLLVSRPARVAVSKPLNNAAPPVEVLSRRQREVLRMLAHGATNRQIADALFISEKTVAIHVSRVLAKLGAANRGQAAAMAHQQGWVSGADEVPWPSVPAHRRAEPGRELCV
ncbi:helix-turn-helix transcriptional regulator [Streptomyces parvus]